jgi:hypothetical protein
VRGPSGCLSGSGLDPLAIDLQAELDHVYGPLDVDDSHGYEIMHCGHIGTDISLTAQNKRHARDTIPYESTMCCSVMWRDWQLTQFWSVRNLEFETHNI